MYNNQPISDINTTYTTIHTSGQSGREKERESGRCREGGKAREREVPSLQTPQYICSRRISLHLELLIPRAFVDHTEQDYKNGFLGLLVVSRPSLLLLS